MLTTAVPAMAVQADAPPGTGAVTVARRGNRSVVTRSWATSPLRLLNPRNHGRAAWVYTASLGGGLVNGDDLALDVEVRPGASAFLSTQSSTKVYRSPRGTRTAIRAGVAAEGLLVVAPDPVVPFADARFRQQQSYDLAGSGGVVVIDWFVSGRRASGERWRFIEYRSLIELRLDGVLRVFDSVALRASDGDLGARFGRFDVLAVAIIAGGLLRNEIACVRKLVSEQPIGRRADLVVAASSHSDDVCVVRVAGTVTEGVGRMLRVLLQFVPSRLGDNPFIRKW